MQREKILNDVVVRNACVRRHEEILNAVTAYGVRDYTADVFVARIDGIFRDEREFLTKAEISLAQAAAEGANTPRAGNQ